jgi:hypothetical protein
MKYNSLSAWAVAAAATETRQTQTSMSSSISVQAAEAQDIPLITHTDSESKEAVMFNSREETAIEAMTRRAGTRR